MKASHVRCALTLLLIGFIILFVTGLWWLWKNPSPKTSGQTTKLEASSLQPGTGIPFVVASHAGTLSIPDGEGHSYGLLHIEIPSLEFSSGPVERDGSIETVWMDDVNGDAMEDAIVVVRNAGSGGYVSIVVLESNESSYSVQRLPEMSSDLMTGYMGHDTVWVKAGSIMRSFPTYEHQDRLRIDRQWKPSEAKQGKAPIKVDSDTNVDPSGSTRHLTFNYQNGHWEER